MCHSLLLQRRPSVKSMKHVREQIRTVADPSRPGKETKVAIRRLSLFLEGRVGHFANGNVSGKFSQIDRYLWRQLLRMSVKKLGRNPGKGKPDCWTSTWFKDQSLHHLHATAPIPEDDVTMSGMPSASRVRENRTRSLKGGWGSGLFLQAPHP